MNWCSHVMFVDRKDVTARKFWSFDDIIQSLITVSLSAGIFRLEQNRKAAMLMFFRTTRSITRPCFSAQIVLGETHREETSPYGDASTRIETSGRREACHILLKHVHIPLLCLVLVASSSSLLPRRFSLARPP
jgi:hypothetical protein